MRKRGSLVAAVVVAVATLSAVGAPGSGAVTVGSTYVALGDSYTAGPGIPLPDPPYGCHRSTNNYPRLVATALSLVLRDASCSGAQTRDMTTAQAVVPGPNPPQFDRLDSGTSLVTLQIGGNDIGFGEIVRRCSSLVPVGTPCQDHFVVDGRDRLQERIADVGQKVGDVIRGVRPRAPSAEVLVLAYPAILPDAGPGCWPVLPVTPGDVPYLQARHKQLNAVLAAVSADLGARYVDVYAPSIGNDACQLPFVRWVEPAVPTSPAAPVHPNLLGMHGMAAAVEAAVRAAQAAG
jgi:lysophospholipase L1-like esterase